MSQHIKTISHAIEAIRDVCGINKGSVTFTEIVEAVIELKQDNKSLHAHDAVKKVKGWVEVEMCTGCGTTMTLEQLAAVAPQAVSCCPERDMRRTLAPANYGNETARIREMETALQAITSIIWGRDSKPHLDDLVESVAGLKESNALLAEQRYSSNIGKMDDQIRDLTLERDGLKRTLDLANAELDSLCNLVGAVNVGSLRMSIGGMIDRCRVLEESARAGLMHKAVFLPQGLEMKTADLIGSFAENLGQRLLYKQRQGYKGWDRDDWQDDCLRRLHTSDKPLDVAAFAVFAWYHDWAGSYEALVTMPGEYHYPPKFEPINLTINIEGSVSGFELSGLLRENLRPQEPTGFRTEPAGDLYRRIANTGAVDDALRELVSDSTEENGVLVVQAIYNALQREGKIR